MEYHLGQRLSLRTQLCTVRYIGPVGNKPGKWLGVEWDDPNRGKHDGSYGGTTYFKCRSSSPTAASFLKPAQKWDASQTFLQALREKYMPVDTGTNAEAVYFSSKQAEEVGFDKFARRQAQLQGIHVLVLDRMRITAERLENDSHIISEICSHITELDLGGNLFESLSEVVSLCKLMPKLRRLVLDENRFNIDETQGSESIPHLDSMQSLSLSSTLLHWSELCSMTSIFPRVTSLAFAGNAIASIGPERLKAELISLDLSGNIISAFSGLEPLSRCPSLRMITLKRNRIDRISSTLSNEPQPILFGQNITDVDLAFNEIASWSIINAIPQVFPKAQNLRVTGNPLYNNLHSADGKALNNDDGHMLTIARIPHLDTLDYSKITDKERLNAETYYLGQIGVELSLAAPEREPDILAAHPRWQALCEEYGAPTVTRRSAQPTLDPNSLAAKLVTFHFALAPGTLPAVTPRSWVDHIPKSISIYALRGIVGKYVDVRPLELRLIWETGERDPVGLDRGYAGPEWWDSDDEGESGGSAHVDTLVLREVELVPGTRAIGTYIDGQEARIRVQTRGGEWM